MPASVECCTNTAGQDTVFATGEPSSSDRRPFGGRVGEYLLKQFPPGSVELLSADPREFKSVHVLLVSAARICQAPKAGRLLPILRHLVQVTTAIMDENGGCRCVHIIVVVGADREVVGGGAGFVVALDTTHDNADVDEAEQMIARAEIAGVDPRVAGRVPEGVAGGGDDDPGVAGLPRAGGDRQAHELLVLVTLDDRQDRLTGGLAGGRGRWR